MFDTNEEKRIPGLPSWVPDWSLKSTRQTMLSEKVLYERFQASPHYARDAQVSFPEASTEGYGRVLRIEVFNIGNLSVEGAFGPADGGSMGEKIESWKRKAGLSNPADKYVAGGTLEDAFIETLFVFNPQLNTRIDLDHVRGSHPDTQGAYETVAGWQNYIERLLNGEWCFFVNPRGYMGVTPSKAKYDDYLCIALGAPVPFILRKCGERYNFIGEAYVHGLMYGEAMKMIEAESYRLKS